MSVAKAGADDVQLRPQQRRRPAPGRLPPRRRRHRPSSRLPPTTTRRRPSRVPAAYNEVITVSALADTDGKRGGLGGNRCYSWGGYDKDDTFADFSNYGSDVDLIAPGKCIWSTKPGNTYAYIVRDVDGRARGHRRGRALQVEPPERDPGRGQGGAPVPRHLRLEDLDRPGLVPREAARRLAARAARDVRPRHLGARLHEPVGRGRRRSRSRSTAAARSSSGSASTSRRCRPAGPPRSGPSSLLGWTADAHDDRRRRARTRSRPAPTTSGSSATNQGRTATRDASPSWSRTTSRPCPRPSAS